MNDKKISNSEAELLLHRYVTERVPLLAFFVSVDQSITIKLDEFMTTSMAGAIVLSCGWPGPDDPMPSYLKLAHAQGSWCEYSDETEVPEGFEFGSGLRLNFPNGDTLFILEHREEKKA